MPYLLRNACNNAITIAMKTPKQMDPIEFLSTPPGGPLQTKRQKHIQRPITCYVNKIDADFLVSRDVNLTALVRESLRRSALELAEYEIARKPKVKKRVKNS